MDDKYIIWLRKYKLMSLDAIANKTNMSRYYVTRILLKNGISTEKKCMQKDIEKMVNNFYSLLVEVDNKGMLNDKYKVYLEYEGKGEEKCEGIKGFDVNDLESVPDTLDGLKCGSHISFDEKTEDLEKLDGLEFIAGPL